MMLLTPLHVLHIYPVVALALLTFTIMFIMGRRRFRAVKNGMIPVGYFKLYREIDGQGVPETVQVVSRNYANLFEMPVLFYAIIPLLIITDHADSVTLTLSWLFVIIRYVHSFVHITSNKLLWRMRIWFVSTIVLLLLWVRFAIDMFTNQNF